MRQARELVGRAVASRTSRGQHAAWAKWPLVEGSLAHSAPRRSRGGFSSTDGAYEVVLAARRLRRSRPTSFVHTSASPGRDSEDGKPSQAPTPMFECGSGEGPGYRRGAGDLECWWQTEKPAVRGGAGRASIRAVAAGALGGGLVAGDVPRGTMAAGRYERQLALVAGAACRSGNGDWRSGAARVLRCRRGARDSAVGGKTMRSVVCCCARKVFEHWSGGPGALSGESMGTRPLACSDPAGRRLMNRKQPS